MTEITPEYKAAKKAQYKAWYEKNKEKLAETRKAYHEKNKAKKAAIQRRYVEQNREKVYAAAAEFARTHKKERAAYYREYRKRIWGKNGDNHQEDMAFPSNSMEAVHRTGRWQNMDICDEM